jgi:hypothetical protein
MEGIQIELLEKLANDDPEILKKNLYKVLSKFSFLYVEGLRVNFNRGWASTVTDRHGTIFTSKEAKQIEHFFASIVKPLTNTPETNHVKKILKLIEEHFKDLNLKIAEFSREFGSFRFSYQKAKACTIDFPVPLLDSPYSSVIKIPEKDAVPIIIDLIIESIRLISSLENSRDIMQKCAPFLGGLIDILKGNWKEGFLSWSEFSPAVAGLLGKVFLLLIDFTYPKIHDFAVMHSNSIFTVFLYWGFANFSPESDRMIVSKYLDSSIKESNIFLLSEKEIKELYTMRGLESTPLHSIPIFHLLLLK